MTASGLRRSRSSGSGAFSFADHEILEGWHVEQGYMWPYVLAAYFFSPLIVGLAVRAAT